MRKDFFAKICWQSYRARMEHSVEVSDVRALRALAHPLRNRLLGALRLDGPSTATLLGARVGESSGSTSYHLRQLAAYGFVEEVDGPGAGRWWQARHRQSSWTTAALVQQPEGAEVAEEALRLTVGVQGRLLEAWLDQRGTLPEPWTGVSSVNDYALRLRPEQAAALRQELFAVLDRWSAAHPTDVPVEGSLGVSLLLDLLPLPQWPV